MKSRTIQKIVAAGVIAFSMFPIAAGENPVSEKIVCGGEYKGHLQGTDAAGTNIWWSFDCMIVRTDLSGKVMATQEAPNHQGDLCVKGDTLYVAVNLGPFNTETKGKSCVTAYDAMTLVPKKTWNIDMPHGAGGMTWKDDRFYVIGGLPPTHDRNYVYEYDSDFRLVKRHELLTGYTVLGIQTAAFVNGEFLFGIYGGKGNPGGILRCPADLSSFRRYIVSSRYGYSGAVGIAQIGGRIYTASTPSVYVASKTWTGTLYPADDMLDDKFLFNTLWYRDGRPRNEAMRLKRVSLGNGAGKFNYMNREDWLREISAAAAAGFDTLVIDLADGVVYSSKPELAAKGAWDGKTLSEELMRLRSLGIEPIPCLDLTAEHAGWLGCPVATPEALKRARGIIGNVLGIFGHPRYFQVIADGWSAADRAVMRDAVIAYGYGSCPWPVH